MKAHRLSVVCALILFTTAAFAQKQGVIFLVRHAERADTGGDAALLNSTGEKRAQCLAKTLDGAGIQKIYVTDIQRTQQTAAPLAQELHLQPTVIPKKDLSELLRDLRETRTQHVLVVGHADTLPEIVQRLGVGTIPPSPQQDYDRMIIIPVIHGKLQPMITIHYCPAAP
ncbi:MAG TPA: phosphoglycerate mutase family protein [Terriglobales bacterium]|nr:phosphoglycerate mutase family protein [Terriglobales bacterium]